MSAYERTSSHMFAAVLPEMDKNARQARGHPQACVSGAGERAEGLGRGGAAGPPAQGSGLHW